MCEAFNIKIDSTPSYSPWSNRLCERHNQTLTNMFLKIGEDIKCDMDTALAWAVSAKNTLINNNGFSPAQVALGKNCMFPSIINDILPALESFNQSPNLALHIATLHSAWRAFIAYESSEKIKRPFRNNIRSSGQIYNIKDEVYYKRSNSPKWKGPAKVLGQDGPVVFLRHGTRHIKAHVCRVQSTENSINEKNDKDHTPPPPTPLANQPHNMSLIEAQSKLNTINHDVETDSESEVSKIHTNQKIHFLHHRHNYHHLHYNYKYHHHCNYHHRNHNFKNHHHYHNHHYQQKHLH